MCRRKALCLWFKYILQNGSWNKHQETTTSASNCAVYIQRTGPWNNSTKVRNEMECLKKLSDLVNAMPTVIFVWCSHSNNTILIWNACFSLNVTEMWRQEGVYLLWIHTTKDGPRKLTLSAEWPPRQWLVARNRSQQLPCSHSSCLQIQHMPKQCQRF
jgi:hypothetical protein